MKCLCFSLLFVFGCGTGRIYPIKTPIAENINSAYIETNLAYNFQDVVQGKAGDCWLVASIAAVALNDQNAIHKVISTDDSAYRVSLFIDWRWTTIIIAKKNIDPDFEETDPLWGDAIEQGAVNLNNVYHFLNIKGGEGAVNGGIPSTALYFLTSMVAESVSADDPVLWDALLDKNGKPCVASTVENPPDKYVIGSHAYTVIASGLYNGVQSVMLRNPWKWNPAGGLGTPELERLGVIVVDLDTFKKNFIDIEWVTE